jgi:hypothetical protein
MIVLKIQSEEKDSKGFIFLLTYSPLIDFSIHYLKRMVVLLRFQFGMVFIAVMVIIVILIKLVVKQKHRVYFLSTINAKRLFIFSIFQNLMI